jgi:sec-independent protein translocase protein TatA
MIFASVDLIALPQRVVGAPRYGRATFDPPESVRFKKSGSGVFEMGSFSAWHWLIVLVVVLLFFGKGKIPELMGDLAHGIRAFKKGVEDEKDDNART